MIDKDDLRAAVGAGLVTERQAAALSALAQSRAGAREHLHPGDEPFELFRGFNEIFIIVGLAILAVGWGAVAGWIVADRLETWRTTAITLSVLSAVPIWLLSEYFIRRRRMIGPAIFLTILFAAATGFGFIQKFGQIFQLAQGDTTSLIGPGLLSVGAVFIFWLRFRVPFAMALMALGLFSVSLQAAASASGTPDSLRDIFVLSAGSGLGWVTLALGLATFALAMVFDASDPHRVTRRAAQGFWLHLVAAPMIINTVALSLFQTDSPPSYTLLLVAMVIFALVAIAIDRRSFLLAAIGYVVAVLVALNPLGDGVTGPVLVLLLGVFLVSLGAFWARIRAAILAILPLGRLRAYLPPAH